MFSKKKKKKWCNAYNLPFQPKCPELQSFSMNKVNEKNKEVILGQLSHREKG